MKTCHSLLSPHHFPLKLITVLVNQLPHLIIQIAAITGICPKRPTAGKGMSTAGILHLIGKDAADGIGLERGCGEEKSLSIVASINMPVV